MPQAPEVSCPGPQASQFLTSPKRVGIPPRWTKIRHGICHPQSAESVAPCVRKYRSPRGQLPAGAVTVMGRQVWGRRQCIGGRVRNRYGRNGGPVRAGLVSGRPPSVPHRRRGARVRAAGGACGVGGGRRRVKVHGHIQVRELRDARRRQRHAAHVERRERRGAAAQRPSDACRPRWGRRSRQPGAPFRQCWPVSIRSRA
eukprot:gene9619-biopygen9273